MSCRAAILGLGGRGARWAAACDAAGWRLHAFDPDPRAGDSLPRGVRSETISASVRDAHWVICCLPERLELVQKVVQRVQSEAPREAVIAIVSDAFDLDMLQSCALRPEQLVQLSGDGTEGVSLDVTDRNDPEMRVRAETALAELAAGLSLIPSDGNGDQEAESA